MIDCQCNVSLLNLATNVLVGFIGSGIVVLLGVNIWYSFRIGSTIKKRVSEGLTVLRKENNELKNDLINHSTAAFHLVTARQFSDYKNYDLAFFFYLKGVESIIKVTEENRTTEMIDIYDQCLDNSLGLTASHQDAILKSGTINNMKGIIESILIDTKDQRSSELYALLFSVFHKS